MRRYSYDDRFGFLCTKFTPFVAKSERIEFYKSPPKNWSWTLEVLITDNFIADRWDKTLLELHYKMGIGDFSELIDFKGEPADYDIGTEKYHDLMFFDPYLLASIEWQDTLEILIYRQNMKPVALDDDDDEEEEILESIGDFDELWEPEPDYEDELPGSFGELMNPILRR